MYIKTSSWEYWPMWLVYLPATFYFIYLSIKARSLFFFSASNPTIETGGMFFESKWQIFKLLPKDFYPNTIYVPEQATLHSIQENMFSAGIDFPIIAKPDRGERGWCVKKLHSPAELEAYHARIPFPFLIQSYIDYPLELSILYFRNPNNTQGKISSVTLKKLLSITGDGVSTIDALIQRNNRAMLQYDKLKQNKDINFDDVLQHGAEKLLVPYGNHALGAMFLNYNHIIDESLLDVFDNISKHIEGFYFGRFDLRCSSIEDLKKGRNMSILELNGAGAEPAHIYDPQFHFFAGQKVILQHFNMIYQAAIENKKKGADYMTLWDFLKIWNLKRAYKRIQG